MELHYDKEADVLEVTFREPEGRIVSRRIDEKRIVHYDDTRMPLGVEFLFVSLGMDLRGLPREDEIRALLTEIGKLTPAA